MPFWSRVMQIAPPPMPTFTKRGAGLGQVAEGPPVDDVAGADGDVAP